MGIRTLLPSMLLLVATTEVRSQYGDNQGGSCVTPDKLQGKCVAIRDCELLGIMLKESQYNPSYVNFLRRSQCGSDYRRWPLVCCPLGNRGNRRTSVPVKSRKNAHIFPNPPKCGIVQVREASEYSRVVGGSPAKLGAWPWMVAYGYTKRRSPSSALVFLCGGSLVSEKHTITAAHCINHPQLRDKQMKVARLGDLNLKPTVDDGANPVDIAIKSKITHPQFRRSNNKIAHDIGIVILQRPVTFNRLIQPICLPFGPGLKDDDFVGKHPFIAGWGQTSQFGSSSNHLLQTQVEVEDNLDCAEKYGNAIISDKQLCAAGYADGTVQDSCQGDSGGPLMQPKDGSKFYLIGIVVGGRGCAVRGYPGIYTRVTSYLDWIENVISKNP